MQCFLISNQVVHVATTTVWKVNRKLKFKKRDLYNVTALGQPTRLSETSAGVRLCRNLLLQYTNVHNVHTICLKCTGNVPDMQYEDRFFYGIFQ
jgi:hypothetical protein